MRGSKGFSTEEYRALFDIPATGSGSLELRHGMVSNYRTKLRQAGPIRIYDLYPVHYTRAELRQAKSQLSSAAAEKQNEKDARLKFILKAHENFGPGDLHISLTYGCKCALEQAQRDACNYVRSLRRAANKQGAVLRWMSVVEYNDQTERAHLHMLVSGIDRETAEGRWKRGWANADRIKSNGDGIMALAKYLTKGQRGKRRWNCSTNLRQSRTSSSDHKLSKRKVERICADSVSDGKAIFEAIAPGYRLMEPIEPRRSEFLSGVYIQARMIEEGYYQAYRTDPQNRTREEEALGEEYLERERERGKGSDNRTPKTRLRAARARGPSPGSAGRKKGR